MRNKESNKQFIGLRWSTINNLLDSILGELFFCSKRLDSKVIGKNRKKIVLTKFRFSWKVVTRTNDRNLCKGPSQIAYDPRRNSDCRTRSPALAKYQLQGLISKAEV